MGVIYELVKLPEKSKEKFLEGILHQEAAEKLKLKRTGDIKIKTSK